ncbi:recombinase family protein [Lyngbya aestuarii]|uniref:recombinase family protein n=1 Tax=Lyngbya aestuarii TaxID=118322 RepID=UPI00403DDEED
MVAEKEEDESVCKRLDEARKAKAAKGEYTGYGSPAFGQKSLDGKLVEDAAEQQIIELIRRHHKSGKSLQRIADWLNFHGYKTKRGQQWKKISVKRVLDRLYGKSTRVSGVIKMNTSEQSRGTGNPDSSTD